MLPFYTSDQLMQLPADARLGVIGNPIAHSKSPQMQQPALDAAGIPARYVRLLADTKEGAFESLLQQLAARDFIGVNVTVPFKKRAHDAAVFLDPLAQLSGAVNTLVSQADGWHGYNTDGPGFSRAIEECFGRPLRELRVLIMGACGGAGSALACQCALEQCPALTLVNRPRPELALLVAKLKPHTAALVTALHFDSPELPAAVAAADLIVNATSLGLHEGDPMPISPDLLLPGQCVYDIVTHETALQRAAAARGCRAATGQGMLLWQGAIAFEHWFGLSPDTPAMRHGLGI
ncbi:MAG: shikimate dehydrogenase [Akkermansia sp.]|nr:shikimate dehydrogenase [Akkermansia sp.]MBR2313356.1 shikimate dehydrogenase [Akkermansia sp.]